MMRSEVIRTGRCPAIRLWLDVRTIFEPAPWVDRAAHSELCVAGVYIRVNASLDGWEVEVDAAVRGAGFTVTAWVVRERSATSAFIAPDLATAKHWAMEALRVLMIEQAPRDWRGSALVLGTLAGHVPYEPQRTGS